MFAGAQFGAAAMRRKKCKRLGTMKHWNKSIRERNPNLGKEAKVIKGLNPED